MLPKLLIVAAALAIVALLIIPGTFASHEIQGPGVIRITDRQIQLARIDVGKAGRSLGDVHVARLLLYNKRITPRTIGHAELVCTLTSRTTSNCSGTYFLPRGKIIVGGPMRFRELYEVAVLGGTGIYDNVRGTLTVTSIGGKPRRDILVFRLVV